eukprot:1158331-Pelagomonas_calceolata.AAC.6
MESAAFLQGRMVEHGCHALCVHIPFCTGTADQPESWTVGQPLVTLVTLEFLQAEVSTLGDWKKVSCRWNDKAYRE